MQFLLQTIIFIMYVHTLRSHTFTDPDSSFLQYDQWQAEKLGVLKFNFKTYKPYGILLYSDNSKSSNSVESFITVKLNYGKIEFTVQMGSEDYKSKRSQSIGKNLDDLDWHSVEIKRQNKDTKLILDFNEEIVLTTDGEIDILELNSGLFFGGLSPQLSTSLIDKTISLMPRFTGCIENITYETGTSSLNDVAPVSENSTSEVENSSQNIVKIISSTKVEPGCLNACDTFTCPNNGRCNNYFISAKCDCIGTGFHGRNCTIESDAVEFSGNDYISVSLAGPTKSTSHHDIKLRFKTRESNGIIMVASSGYDHLMLELHQTIIRFSMDLGGGYHIWEINDIVFSDGVWHLIEIDRNERNINLMVDKKYDLKGSTAGMHSQFDLREDLLYIGGHPKVKSLGDIYSKSKSNFIGCLQQVYYNDLDIVYKVLYTKSNRFNTVGDVKLGCSVVKRKLKNNRNIDTDVSKSSSGVVDGRKTTDVPDTLTPDTKMRGKMLSDDSQMSTKTVIWIAVGLIFGFILMVATLVILIRGIQNRYTGVFLSSAYKKAQQNSDKTSLKSNNANGHVMNTILYSRKYNNVSIEPHLV